MTDQEVRQWCLEFARLWFTSTGEGTDVELIALAKSFWDFIDRAHVAE
jgi:hypothetical protein